LIQNVAKTAIAKPMFPEGLFKAFNGMALLGAGPGTLAEGTGGEDSEEETDEVGAISLLCSTLMSTFCPAWQWPGTPQKKKW
jgi:hypothetical protein